MPPEMAPIFFSRKDSEKAEVKALRGQICHTSLIKVQQSMEPYPTTQLRSKILIYSPFLRHTAPANFPLLMTAILRLGLVYVLVTGFCYSIGYLTLY